MKTDLHSTAKRYNKILAGLVLAVLMIFAGTNILIDPKNQLGLWRIDNINSIKYLATGGRYEKSSRLTHGKFDTVLAGTSRTQVGIDPKQPAFNKHRVYNAALSATNMQETASVLMYALKHQEIKLVIIGLDFLMFNRNRPMPGDHMDSLFVNSYDWLMPYLLSTSTFKRSIETIKLNQSTSTRTHSDDNGFLDKTGAKVNHRQLFRNILSGNFLENPETYGAYEYGFEHMKYLEQVLKTCINNNINIRLFISPAHAVQLEAIRAMGIWETYIQWKKDLVALTYRINTKYSSAVPLWDFSGYNNITTEAIPALNSDKTMQWYWESSHYKKSVGNFIIPIVLHNDRTQAPWDFGVILAHENINQQIKQTEVNREIYATRQPAEIDEIAKLVDATRATRSRNARKAGVSALQPEL